MRLTDEQIVAILEGGEAANRKGLAFALGSEKARALSAEALESRATIDTLTKERDEARAYLKAFVYATIDPEDKRADAQLHKANPSIGWLFVMDDTESGGRQILSSQVRRAMEIVGYDKLKIEAPATTVADDLVEANRAKHALAAEVLESRAEIAAKDARIAELAADASACRAALTNTFITVNEQADEIVKLTREPDEAISDASDDADISASLLEWADSIDADGDDLRPLLRRAAEALTDRLAQIKSAVDAAAKFAERNAALSARIAELEAALLLIRAQVVEECAKVADADMLRHDETAERLVHSQSILAANARANVAEEIAAAIRALSPREAGE